MKDEDLYPTTTEDVVTWLKGCDNPYTLREVGRLAIYLADAADTERALLEEDEPF